MGPKGGNNTQVSYKNLVRLAPHRLMMAVFEECRTHRRSRLGNRIARERRWPVGLFTAAVQRYDIRARLSSAAQWTWERGVAPGPRFPKNSHDLSSLPFSVCRVLCFLTHPCHAGIANCTFSRLLWDDYVRLAAISWLDRPLSPLWQVNPPRWLHEEAPAWS